MSLTHSLKWSFLSELASKLVQPVVFVVLARLLTPEDYGVMSAALMVMAFSQIFWEAGMGKALIQRQTDVEAAANVAFWVNFGLGVIIAGLLYIAAKPIAQTFFQDPRVTAVIQVMTFQVFLGALGSVQTALLQKEMGFKKLFWVRLVTVSLPGFASLPLAWQGMGYWALVVGTLVGQLAQLAMLWRVSLWRPSWAFHVPVAKEMGRFGAWVGISGLLAWFYVWVDALVVGMYLGSHDLGLYRAGNQFSAMVFALLLGPIAPVLYSKLSTMAPNRDAISRAVNLMVRVIALASFPAAFLMLAVSDFIEQVIFGENWVGVGHVIGVMALTHGISYITSLNGEAYRAVGQPNVETTVMALPIPLYLAVYMFLAPLGLDAFLFGRFASMLLVATPLNIYLASRLFDLPVAAFIRFSVTCAAISSLIVIIAHTSKSHISSNIFVAPVVSVIATLFVVGLVYFWQRKDIVPILKRMLLPLAGNTTVGNNKTKMTP